MRDTLPREVFEEERFGGLSRAARLLLICLWSRADISGWHRAEPELLRWVFLYEKETPELLAEIAAALDELVAGGSAVRANPAGGGSAAWVRVVSVRGFLDGKKVDAGAGYVPHIPPFHERRTIYLIQSGEGGPIKIGISRDVEDRLAQLQTSHHERLRLLATANGTEDDERELHRRFHRAHKSGEWFRPVPEILALLDSPNWKRA